MVDTDNLKVDFSSEITRLNKMTHNIFAMNEVEYAYSRLISMVFSPTMEFFFEMEILTAGLVISYGRLFSDTSGTTKLRETVIPDDLRSIHNELMSLRHTRHAHHGAHPSIETEIDLSADDHGIILNQSMKIGFCVGAPKHWAPLFVWLREHIHSIIEGQVAHISQKSGVEWRMNKGDAPEWAVRKAT